MSYGYKADSYTYPTGGIVISYMLNFLPQLIIVGFGTLAVYKYGLWPSFKPTRKWKSQINAQPKVKGFVSDDYQSDPPKYDNMAF